MSSEADFPSQGGGAGTGDFQVLRCLGIGRQAETYLVRDPRTGREFVRKVFSAEVSAENPDIVDGSFRPWAVLDHPLLPRVLDFGWQEGRAYLHSEYREGRPLLDALQGAPLEQIWRVFAQVLVALDALYRHNIPHLDLKPQNVLVGADAQGAPQVSLVDYGLLPLLNSPTMTEAPPLGAPPYAAPEFALGRAPDFRADLYSVGILLFMALARRSPFAGEDPAAILQAQQETDAPPLKSLVGGAPPALSDFLQGMLSRDPLQRPASPLAALAALQAAAGPSFPPDAAVFPPFSDFALALRGEEATHLFRRIAMAGGRWAVGGVSGSGKDFLALTLERLFWLNRIPVWKVPGENLSLVQGEPSLNAANPTWLLIPDADRGPVEGWFRGRPYERVIAVAEDLSWVKSSMGWSRYILNPRTSRELKKPWTEAFGAGDPACLQALQRRFGGQPGALVRATRAMAHQGLLRREGAGWLADSEKIKQAASGAKAAKLGHPLAALPEPGRRLYRLLGFAAVPLDLETLAAETGLSTQAALEALQSLSVESWVRRRVQAGREYYEIDGGPLSALEAGFSEAEAWALLSRLAERGWSLSAHQVWQNNFSETRNLGLLAFDGILQSRSGLHAGALRRLRADVVNHLPEAAKAPAWEALGASLLATGQAQPAEAALRQAFPLYKAAQDLAGQARVYALMAGVVERAGQTGKALKLYQQALALAGQAPEKERWQGRVEKSIAELYARATDFDSAESHFQTALGFLESAGGGEELAEAYADYARFCFSQGDPDRAEIFCNEALAWALFYRRPVLQARIFNIWAKVHASREDAAFAIGRYSEAVDSLAASEDRLALGLAWLERAEYLDKYRDVVSAEKDARRAWDLAGREGLEALKAPAALVLGKVLGRDLPKNQEARKYLAFALKHLSGGPRHWECEYSLGELDRMQGRARPALRRFQNAMRLLDQRLAALDPENPETRELTQRRREVEMSAGAVS